MSKLVSYRCNECFKTVEELFNDSEDQPEVLDEPCECGGKILKFNFKNNSHRVYIQDTGGIN